jgi:hypothetical protein
MRRPLLITVTVLAVASAALAADRIVHYEHFTADW